MLHKHILSNGMRVVAEEISSVRSVAIGLWVNVGSRDEGPDEHGVSHFLEHMFFKGTERRSARDISLEIDEMGGELNAFTTRESTTFYAKVLDDDLDKVIDLLADLLNNSAFDPVEIDKERQVILEEISMVEDDPEDLVQELHIKEAWQGNALARPILGTVDSVSDMTREKLRAFIQRCYDPEQMVVAVAGHFDFSKVLKVLDAAFSSYHNTKAQVAPRQSPILRPNIVVEKKTFEQTHLCLGTEGLSYRDPERFPLYILNTVLGGGMSSRLFQEVREERGWAYSIYSAPISYFDGGLLTVYAGAAHKNAAKVVDVVLSLLKSLKQDGITAAELSRAQNQIKGGMMLGMESTSSRMCRIAREELHFGRSFSLEDIVTEIDQVSLSRVQDLSRKLFQTETLTLAVVGQCEPQDFSLPYTL